MDATVKIKRLPKLEIDAIVATLRGPVFNTWQQIGGDVEESCASCEEKLTNAVAIEACLDANRMRMYGGASGVEADELVGKLAREGHYTQVYRALCRALQLA